MFRKITLSLFSAAIFSTSGALLASGQADYEKALSNAKAEQEAAQAVGGEWRDTGKTLKKAEAAAKEGNYGVATKLASKAEFQSKIGQEQAKSQVNAGNPGYLN